LAKANLSLSSISALKGVAINPSFQPSQFERIICYRYYKKLISTKLNSIENDYLKESIAVPFRAWNKKMQIGFSQTL
jgi:hypothetical protein